MLLFDHGDRVFRDHGWWLGFSRWFLPLLLVALIGLTLWAVLRSSRGTAAAVMPAAGPDGALEEVRLRYARRDIDREEFIQRSGDLGSQPGPPQGA